MDGKCCVQLRSCSREKIPEMHEELRKYACKVLECRPIVLEARKYIHANYQRRELDLTQVADATGCNASYLSRMMKQELGISFKDFLTTLRINQAIFLMRDHRLSINQIAEQVGYTAISIIFQRHSKTARAFPVGVPEDNGAGGKIMKRWMVGAVVLCCLLASGCNSKKAMSGRMDMKISSASASPM